MYFSFKPEIDVSVMKSRKSFRLYHLISFITRTLKWQLVLEHDLEINDGFPCFNFCHVITITIVFFFLELNTPVRLFHYFIQRQRCNSSEYIICTLSTQLVHKNCQHIAFEILSMTVRFQNFKFFY